MTLRSLAAAAFLLLALAGPAAAQYDILTPDTAVRVFYVELKGTINAKSAFQNVRAQVIITHTPQGHPNPLQVVIEGLPALAERNSIYWNTDFGEMQVQANTLKSIMKHSWTREQDIHFYYMSPALYKNKYMATQHEAERIRWINTHAKPIKIMAKEAVLSLTVQGNRLFGNLWMAGTDSFGHEPVRYVASFSGSEFVAEKPKR